MCSNCIDNLARNGHKLRVPARVSLQVGTRPTVAGLERHAVKFGPAQVAETAAEYGLTVSLAGAVEPRRPRRRRRA